MVAGRPPKPTEDKRRRGNPGGRPLPVPTIVLPAAVGTPDLPRGLHAHGRRLWADAWVAGKLWLTPSLDCTMVEQAARLADECAGFRRDVARLGRIMSAPKVDRGTVVLVDGEPLLEWSANPAVKLLRGAEAELRTTLVELGFTPTARARLGLVQVKAQSKLEDMIARQSAREDAKRASSERLASPLADVDT